MRRNKKWLSGCLLLLLAAAILCFKPDIVRAASGTSGKGAGYSYALRISTGANPGDSIAGFFIRYTDESGNACSEFIDPHNGLLSKSAAEANAAAKDGDASEKIKYLNNLGYDIAAFSDQDNLDALSSNSTNTFLLSFENKISQVTEIDILTDIGVNGATKSWTCVSMELFEVSALKGFDMSGYYSRDYHVDFDGRLLAKAVPPEGSASCQIQNLDANRDSCIAVTEKAQKKALRLVTGSDLGAATGGSSKEVFVEISLADIAGAGIDHFVNEVDDKKKLSEMYLPECLILVMNYRDTLGNARTVSVPVITSALGYAMEQGVIDEDTTLAEFLGQGQNLLLKLNLYDFEKFLGDGKVDFQLIYDPLHAASRVGFQEISKAADTHRKLAEKMISEKDNISILGMYVYEKKGGETPGYELENDCILRVKGDPSSRTEFMTKYMCASNVEGTGIPVSSSSAIHSLTLQPYTQNAVLKPLQTGEKYLVRVRTFAAEEASTSSPVMMKLKYTGEDNEEHETAVISLEEAARTYYGTWPGSGNQDVGYSYGMSAGQTLNCIVPIKDVKCFNSATFTLKGQDTWQFEHVDIARITGQGIGDRHVAWLEDKESVGSVKTDRKVYRDIESESAPVESVIAQYDGTVFLNEKESVKTVDFTGQTVDVTDDTLEDWRENYYKSMPYEVTQQNLGFTLPKINYDVTVAVGSDEVASANGDCGSSNFFYFQLEFEKGKSAYVQANQQLASDAFIEGTEASFSISTNYDYGQLTAVNIIPDDSSADANPYDKLKIDSIRVRRYDNAVDGKLYEWEMKTTEENCWIGIDYREEGESGSTITKVVRDAEAYKTSYTSFEYRSVSQVLVAINTGTYDAGQLVASDMSAKLEGVRLDGSAFTMEVGDVLKRMYDFYGQAPLEEDGKTVSDPSTMFRVGTWNYFLIGMENVKSVDSMTLTYQGKEAGDWKIERVELYRVTKNNGVKIALDNYYCLDGETEQITQSVNSSYIRSTISGPDTPSTVTVSFNEQEKPLEEADTEDFRLNRIPVSRNDYVNIALYMSRGVDDYSDYAVTGAVRYFSNADVVMESSNISFQSEKTGSETVFYANSVGVKDACSINQLKLHAENTKTDAGNCTIDYAIVQRVRAGVVIETYRFDCATNLILGTYSFNPSVGVVSAGDYQMVSVSFGEGTTDMSKKGLTAEIDDVAVAIQYKSTMGDTSTVYQSPYVFLTDQQVKNVHEHSICHLKFTEDYVKEITGIVVASTGKKMEAVVESASVATYVADPANPTLGTVNRMSFKSDGYGCDAVYYVNGKNTLVKSGTKSFAAKKVKVGSKDARYPLSMVFTTGAKQSVALGDLGPANVKIPLEINFRGEDGTDYVYQIDDIKRYLVSGGFGTNETAEIQFMAQDMADINYVVVKVEDDRADTLLRWDLRSIAFSYGDAAGESDFSIAAPSDTYVMEQTVHNTGGNITYTSEGLKLGVKSAVVVLTATASNGTGGVSSVTSTSDAAGAVPELRIMDPGATVMMKADVLGKDVRKSVTVHAGINSEDDSSGYVSINPTTGDISFTVPAGQSGRYTVKAVSDENPQVVAKIIVVVP